MFEIGSNLCPICEQYEKTINYLFWTCELSKRLWFLSNWGIRVDQFQVSTIVDVSLTERHNMTLLASICFVGIWLERNAIVHSKPKYDLDQLVRKILLAFNFYSQALSLNHGLHDLDQASR